MDHILIVDDSPTICAQLGQWLEDMGYRSSSAATGTEGMESLRRELPDLIILDLGLPDVSGLEICRRIRSDEKTARIPIVVLTSSKSESDRIRSLEMGAEDFITKPPTLAELRARIQSLLRAKHLSDRLLISYLEMDRLGTFAESLLARPITDWSRLDVANAMADQVLATEQENVTRPHWIWAGYHEENDLKGFTWRREGSSTVTLRTRFKASELRRLVAPFSRSDGQSSSKDPMSQELATLFGMDPLRPPANFVMVEAGDRILMGADYPWEIGSYEFPLLRAMHRHWKVFERLRGDSQLIEEAFFKTMEALAVAAEFYDTGTGVHIRRVGLLSGRIAGLTGQDLLFVKWITQAAKVHDVGKITIPFDLLAKPDRLTKAEMNVMRRHTTNGAKVLSGSPNLEMARRIAQSHHENFDGSGYPAGLSGLTIPLEARIVKLMDVYDALRSQRVYKEAFSHDKSVEILMRGDDRVQPSHFDPDLLGCLCDNGRELAELFDAVGTEDPDIANTEDALG